MWKGMTSFHSFTSLGFINSKHLGYKRPFYLTNSGLTHVTCTRPQCKKCTVSHVCTTCRGRSPMKGVVWASLCHSCSVHRLGVCRRRVGRHFRTGGGQDRTVCTWEAEREGGSSIWHVHQYKDSSIHQHKDSQACASSFIQAAWSYLREENVPFGWEDLQQPLILHWMKWKPF